MLMCVCVSYAGGSPHIPFYVCPTKVAAGTDMIKQSLRTFVPMSMATVMLIDLISYDGFPALAALEVAWFGFNHMDDSNPFAFIKICYIVQCCPLYISQNRFYMILSMAQVGLQ